MLEAYQGAITSDRLSLRVGDGTFHLVQTPVFAHLWFLWFLCWLVPIFAALAWASDRYHWGRFPRLLVLSPIRFLWLIPLTLLPQFFMGLNGPSFGPDDSTGILPMPHLLLYYGIFFGFGALYFVSDDEEGRLGRWWWLLLLVGFFLALPIGIALMVIRPIYLHRASGLHLDDKLRDHGALPENHQAGKPDRALPIRCFLLAVPDPPAAHPRRSDHRARLAIARDTEVRAHLLHRDWCLAGRVSHDGVATPGSAQCSTARKRAPLPRPSNCRHRRLAWRQPETATWSFRAPLPLYSTAPQPRRDASAHRGKGYCGMAGTPIKRTRSAFPGARVSWSRTSRK